MSKELWRPVVGLEKAYEVSNKGRVRTIARKVWFTSKNGKRFQRLKRVKLMYQGDNGTGYSMVWLHLNYVHYPRTVHSLVAEAFLGPRPKGKEVCHWDGNKKNNNVSNLRYATRKENHFDKRRHGTHACGSKVNGAKLHEKDIYIIRSLESTHDAEEVAEMFGVQPANIERIWNYVLWKHC